MWLGQIQGSIEEEENASGEIPRKGPEHRQGTTEGLESAGKPLPHNTAAVWSRRAGL